MPNIKINICSLSNEVSAITSVVGNLYTTRYPINVTCTKTLVYDDNDIVVIHLEELKSKLLDDFIRAKDKIQIPVLFIISNGNSILVSVLAKLGYNELYVFPDELFKFTSNLKEKIKERYLNAGKSLRVGLDIKDSDFSSLIGNSENARSIISIAKKIAHSSSINSLILGETGTGKGMLARAIHNYASSNKAPYVEVTCTAIPENLLESELFGYEQGAFTDAKNQKPGLFELAENGTIFLDEIGDLSLGLQAKLLRVIERKVIRRLGGVKDIPVNTRIISATNRDLETLVNEKKFRIDLYYRLKVVTIKLKPLRERGNDVILLTEHFINEFCDQYERPVKQISKELIDFMMHYRWPGNIRELKNAFETAIVLYDDDLLSTAHLENLIQGTVEDFMPTISDSYSPKLINMNLNYETTSLGQLEKIYAKEVLVKASGNKSRTAKILGISRPKLDKLLNGHK
jgi:transcriptional regulator with PAS, ATPase and Fis domain